MCAQLHPSQSRVVIIVGLIRRAILDNCRKLGPIAPRLCQVCPCDINIFKDKMALLKSAPAKFL